MNQDKIDKLLRLAHQGVGGEAENAKSILKKAGIDWTKHSPTFGQKIKNVFTSKLSFVYDFRYSTDLFLIMLILEEILSSDAGISITQNGNIRVSSVSYQENLTIDKIYTIENRRMFNISMNSVVRSSLK